MTTKVIKIDPERIDSKKIGFAADVIKKGGIVAFPTETVYGLAADFSNKKAVSRIFAVKKRPLTKALTVQIGDVSYLQDLVDNVPFLAYQLIGKFWPGPLTLVLAAKGGGTIGVRISSNKIAQKLIERAGLAIVAPSANISGFPEAKTADQVLESFNGLIEMVIDAGEVELGRASTVLDLTVSPYKILREGIITESDIQSV